MLSLSLKLSMFMSFKQKRILMKPFVEAQFEVIEVYEFQTKLNSYEDTCWVSVWSIVSLWVLNQSDFSWRHLLSLSLKLSMFMSFKQQRILIKTFVESQFEDMLIYQFQTRASSYEDICWASVWSYVNLWVSNKSWFVLVSVWSYLSLWFSNKIEFLWRHLLRLSLKLFMLRSFKQNLTLLNTFVESQL